MLTYLTPVTGGCLITNQEVTQLDSLENMYASPEEELEVITSTWVIDARNERDRLLAACDWTQGTDSPLSEAQKVEWQNYRQALRDITSADGFPFTHTWPTKPE
jgi:hypothetical protein